MKFQKVAIDGKTGLAGEIVLEMPEIAGGEVHHLAAAGTDKVMVVPGRTPHQIAALVLLRVNGTDEIEVGQELDCAVDRDTPDAGMLLPYPFEERGRRKMVVALRDDLKHRAALWCELVSFTAQDRSDLSGCQHPCNS